jgi:hypothetical protein
MAQKGRRTTGNRPSKGAQQQQCNKGEGRGNDQPNDQPIRRAHTITFGRTQKYSQGLKRARIEGARFRKCHRAAGEGSRYTTYLPPQEQTPSSRPSNIATASEPECTDKSEEYEDDNAIARMSDRRTLPQHWRPFASREEFAATFPIHREVHLFMQKSEAEGADWRYRRWSRAPCDVRVSPNVPGMLLRERAGTLEASTPDVEEVLVFGDFLNRALSMSSIFAPKAQ